MMQQESQLWEFEDTPGMAFQDLQCISKEKCKRRYDLAVSWT